VLDGDIVRRLEVGQVAYVYRGGVTFLQIKRLTGKQAALAPGSASIFPSGLAGGNGRSAGAAGRDAGSLAGLRWSTAGPASSAGTATGWPTDAGVPGEPPTIPLPVIGATPGLPVTGLPGSRVSALPDVSAVLDEAFGVRRD
jgi:hypothetical protein